MSQADLDNPVLDHDEHTDDVPAAVLDDHATAAADEVAVTADEGDTHVGNAKVHTVVQTTVTTTEAVIRDDGHVDILASNTEYRTEIDQEDDDEISESEIEAVLVEIGAEARGPRDPPSVTAAKEKARKEREKEEAARKKREKEEKEKLAAAAKKKQNK